MSTKLMFLLTLWLSFSEIFCQQKDGSYGDGVSSPNDCQNCSICQYPCRPQPPPPAYPSYGAPPPPGTAANCPPTPAQCCQNQYSPPWPYNYVPYNNYSASPPMIFSVNPLVLIFSCATVFFFVFAPPSLV